MNYTSNILDLIGNTPLVKLEKFCNHGGLFAKCEFLNPGGSIKDRVAKRILVEAVKTGKITPGKTAIIEATSGNTGIGMALVGRIIGCEVVIVMPENMSEERKKLITALGARLVLTDAKESLDGCLRKIEELKGEYEHHYIPNQFTNPLNPAVHYETTAQEIWDALEGKIDVFVAGIGSGGTVQGVGSFLKEKNPAIRIVAVEPRANTALLGREPGLHQIQGIGDGFIPDVLDKNLVDMVITVTDDDAINTTRQLAKIEGLLVGTSSGANIWAASELATPGRNVVTVLPDRAERYFSTALI
ncbi:cysteine synthase A [Myxococcota bacterium]|nr:cysteine synthase A [Myxococcota bacterium]MBU1382387.1 cysteine synthase A [Myxococcota bacterium]MBU1499199.1 cysteine synthase A [Myxococcota bacterium]